MKDLLIKVLPISILVISIATISVVASIASSWCFQLVDTDQNWIRCILSTLIGFSASVLLSHLLTTIFYYNNLGAMLAAGCASLFFFGIIGSISGGMISLILLY
jgi:hypothetical protein